MGQGPLSDPQLAEIEAKLNAGRFDEAQRLLAELGGLPDTESASAYFATRLLFQRGKLDRAGVIERLRDLLARATHFPEAQRMLLAAESGILEPSTEGFNRATRPPPARSARVESGAGGLGAQRYESNRATSEDESENEIPPAPLVPRFTPNVRARSDVSELPTLEGPTLEGPSLERSMLEAPTTDERPSQAAPRSRTPPKIPSLEIPAVSASFLASQSARARLPTEAPSSSERTAEAHTPTPSLFEIAAALDAGDPGRALELCDHAKQAGPELTLLTARALSGLHRKDQALSLLDRLLRAPLVERVVRSASARLLIELGQPEPALVQARRALAEDPEDPVTRVTCIWALLRMLVRTGDPALADEAAEWIAKTAVREGALSVLFSALSALFMAERGDAAHALRLSQSTLEQDPRQLDAISAMAIAYARLGHPSDAESAQKRLFELNPDEARATESAILRHGIVPTRAPASSQAKARSMWGEIEADLVRGRRDAAVQAFESACVERVRALAGRSQADAWSNLGSIAARLFSELPVLRHFAPYDRSVFSVERLDAALRVLYGKNARRHADEPVLALLGAYVGESWRQAFGGEWQGVPLFPFSASVEVTGLSVRPCERVQNRLRDGSPLELDAPPSLHPGADPFGHSVPLSIGPPAPWDPEPWPSLSRLSDIGRLLPESVVGYYCASELEIPLDHSVSGVVAIDRYVELLAPANAPPDPDAAWARRAAVLLGAYLGEVVVEARGARWETGEEGGPQQYRLVFRDGSSALPVSRVIDRLAGRRMSPLADYVSQLATGRPSLSDSA